MEISYEKRIWVPSDPTHLRYGNLTFESPRWDVGGFYSIAYMGAYDYILDRIRPDDVVVDGGANIGVFSILASRKAKQVFAVEPHPRNYQALCRNIELNHAKNVTPVNSALGPMEGVAHIMGHGESVQVERNGHAVPMTTIDRLTGGKATVIKMDVEGFEVAAMLTQETLRTARLLAVEMDRDNLERVNRDPELNHGVTANYEQFAETLKGAGYALTRQNEVPSRLFSHLQVPGVVSNELRTMFFGVRSLLFPLLLSHKNLLTPQSWSDDQFFFWMLYGVRD